MTGTGRHLNIDRIPSWNDLKHKKRLKSERFQAFFWNMRSKKMPTNRAHYNPFSGFFQCSMQLCNKVRTTDSINGFVDVAPIEVAERSNGYAIVVPFLDLPYSSFSRSGSEWGFIRMS